MGTPRCRLSGSEGVKISRLATAFSKRQRCDPILPQVRQAFHESFAAAFTGTLRLNVIVPIAIAILTMILMMGKKEGRKEMVTSD